MDGRTSVLYQRSNGSAVIRITCNYLQTEAVVTEDGACQTVLRQQHPNVLLIGKGRSGRRAMAIEGSQDVDSEGVGISFACNEG
jgi:hypothetical protein